MTKPAVIAVAITCAILHKAHSPADPVMRNEQIETPIRHVRLVPPRCISICATLPDRAIAKGRQIIADATQPQRTTTALPTQVGTHGHD